MKSLLLKGTGKIDGDGWKDTTVRGEVIFAYPRELPTPYGAGQFARVGNVGWTASRRQYDFRPATFWEVVNLIPQMIADIPAHRRHAFRWARD